MNFLKRLMVVFYVLFMLYVSCTLLMLISHWVTVDQIVILCQRIFTNDRARMVLGGGAILLLVINYMFYQLFTINVRRDKNIAFDNPSGRVSVSLVALEDLLKRKIVQLEDVKESKITINASRKGLLANVRVGFCSDVSIPELTAKVQSLVKKKVQDVIGLEEKVEVMVYVGKIFSDKTKEKVEVKKEEDLSHDENVPFQGYRA